MLVENPTKRKNSNELNEFLVKNLIQPIIKLKSKFYFIVILFIFFSHHCKYYLASSHISLLKLKST